MAGDSPRSALDTFIGRFQRAIACVAEAHVAGEGYELDQPHSIATHPYRPGPGNRLQLHSRESGRPDLLLDVIYDYAIVHVPNGDQRGPFQVQATRYLYEIFDLEGTELLLYHWHPGGLSSVTTPHLHAVCAPRISLPRPRTNATRQIDVGKLHLPTNQVLLEDVIELLIRDVGVDPRPEFRDPGSPRFWKTVLHDNRDTARRESPESG